MYAILDIETTGGKYNEEGITEIAIYKFDGHDIVDRFVSLVNPERKIQPFVEKLTGINNAMLRTAPKFPEVAKRIVEITEGCIIVAHNVAFDYRMLRTEFDRLGFPYKRQTLCTVILSRKLIPGQKTYKLGKLAHSLGIPISKRHRADGDARATVQIFKLLLAKDSSKTIIKKTLKEAKEHLIHKSMLDILEGLPTKTGVYYIHRADGSIIYIGHTKNIKAKVTRHFTAVSKIAKIIQKEATSVHYELTGTALIATLKAYQEINQNKPDYNTGHYNAILKKGSKSPDFPHENMVIIDKGREVDERSAVLIENNTFSGFGFFNLNYQIKNIRILRSIITPMEYNNDINQIIKAYLTQNNALKIISF